MLSFVLNPLACYAVQSVGIVRARHELSDKRQSYHQSESNFFGVRRSSRFFCLGVRQLCRQYGMFFVRLDCVFLLPTDCIEWNEGVKLFEFEVQGTSGVQGFYTLALRALFAPDMYSSIPATAGSTNREQLRLNLFGDIACVILAHFEEIRQLCHQ